MKVQQLPRLFAGIEVTVATMLVWFGYKLSKLVETGGFNCSPGLTMMAGAAMAMACHRRQGLDWGLRLGRWREDLRLAVAFCGVMVLAGAVETLVMRAAHTRTPMTTAARLVFLGGLICAMTRPWFRLRAERLPLAVVLTLLALMVISLPVLAIAGRTPAVQVVGFSVSLIVCTAFGEELFFRGYMQSRLNAAFGRPWRFLGIAIGPGLFVTSLLFGLIHLLNPAQPYEGDWRLDPLWGVSACLSGLFYGLIREMTGSFWPGVLIHAIGGVNRGMVERGWIVAGVNRALPI